MGAYPLDSESVLASLDDWDADDVELEITLYSCIWSDGGLGTRS